MRAGKHDTGRVLTRQPPPQVWRAFHRTPCARHDIQARIVGLAFEVLGERGCPHLRPGPREVGPDALGRRGDVHDCAKQPTDDRVLLLAVDVTQGVVGDLVCDDGCELVVVADDAQETLRNDGGGARFSPGTLGGTAASSRTSARACGWALRFCSHDSTGHGAWRATCSATLPRTARCRPVRPWLPMMRMSAGHSRAALLISLAGSPSTTNSSLRFGSDRRDHASRRARQVPVTTDGMLGCGTSGRLANARAAAGRCPARGSSRGARRCRRHASSGCDPRSTAQCPGARRRSVPSPATTPADRP